MDIRKLVLPHESLDDCSSLRLCKNVQYIRINYNIVNNMGIILNQNAFIASLEHMLKPVDRYKLSDNFRFSRTLSNIFRTADPDLIPPSRDTRFTLIRILMGYENYRP